MTMPDSKGELTNYHINPLKKDRNPHCDTDDLADRPDFAVVKWHSPYLVDVHKDDNVTDKQPGVNTKDQQRFQRRPHPARNAYERMFD